MLYLITWLTDFSAFLLMFSVQRELAEQHAGTLVLGLYGAGFTFLSALSSVVCGSLSDRLGRRRMAMTGLAILTSSVGLVTLLPAHSVAHGLAYCLGGIALGAIYPALIAWLGEGRRGANRSAAYLLFCLSFNLGIVSGLLTGGWLFDNWGPHSPLMVAIVLALTCMVLLSLYRAPTPIPAEVAGEDSAASGDPRSHVFRQMAWVANFAGTFSASIVFFLFPQLLVELRVPADSHGMLVGATRLVVMAVYTLMHFTSLWKWRFSYGIAAHLIGVASLWWLSTAASAPGLAAGLCGVGLLLGFNYFAGLFYSTDASRDADHGSASGWHEATLALGFAGGCLLGGWAGALNGSRAPFRVAAVAVALCLLVQIVLRVRRFRMEPTMRNSRG